MLRRGRTHTEAASYCSPSQNLMTGWRGGSSNRQKKVQEWDWNIGIGLIFCLSSSQQRTALQKYHTPFLVGCSMIESCEYTIQGDTSTGNVGTLCWTGDTVGWIGGTECWTDDTKGLICGKQRWAFR
jgi:hypothetical protein